DGRHSRFSLESPGKITAIAKKLKAHFTNKFVDDPSISDQQWAKREKIIAFAGHPLIVENRLVGVIALFSKKELSEVTVDTLGAVADEIAIGVVKKKSEVALRESREMLQMVMDNIPQYIFWKDFNSVYKGCNKNFAKAAGAGAPEEIIGKSDFDMPWKKEEIDSYRECDRRVMDTNAPEYHIVETQRRADGKNLWVNTNKVPLHDPDGKVIGILGTYEDITGQKQVEEERALLSAAIEQAAELVIITDSDEKIEYVNPAFEKITGFSADQAKGETPRIIGSGKQGKEFYKKMWDKLFNREVWSGRLVNKKNDGSFYDAETTISPIVDLSGKVGNYICVQRDVTRETQLERQSRQSQKMEAIGVMAGGIAHDFNNILSAIIGYTELAISDSKQEDASYENLTEVMNAASRAKDIVRQILTFSRRDEREMSPVDLAHLITQTIKLVRASLPSTIEIHHSIDADSGKMLADPTLIQQVLLNLCANAEHAMREKGGKLEIKLSAQETGAKEKRRLKLTVADTGYGIEKKVMDKIFDPFFTTKPVGEGTGLGLATVHGIVTGHGGAISVYSAPDEGATFTIYFPKADGEKERRSTESEFIPKGDESILFVDDEAQLLNMGRQTLERLGYKITTAANGHDALDIFKTRPDKFDLVITDQTMPGMTGAVLIARLHEIRPGLPVILCTGFGKSMTPEKAKAAGAREYILKPVLSRDLGLAIRRALERRKLLRRAGDKML
ncbi:diguanylate cyclase/phosphodiesterase (GGDEF & EAL domains) with PAS/PAC sensor(s), partial [hydrothermal vent metagenome]